MANRTAFKPHGCCNNSAIAASYSAAGSVQYPSEIRMQTGGNPRSGICSTVNSLVNNRMACEVAVPPATVSSGQTNCSIGTDLGPTCHPASSAKRIARVILLKSAGWTEEEIPKLLKSLDDDFLPDVDLERGTLAYTVILGELIGVFEAESSD